MYLPNKYTTWYFNIIASARSRLNLSGYTENHHIIPKSLGGSNNPNNLIRLTAKEHFICHLLLVKMCTNDHKRKMSYAMKRMVSGSNRYQNRYKINSTKYEKLKILLNNNLKGRTFGIETRKKMSDAKKGRSQPEHIANALRVLRKGKTNSTEHKEKCSKALTGRTISVDSRKMMSLNHSNVLGINNPRAKKWKVVSPNGIVTIVEGTMTQFCREQNLPASVMRTIGRTGNYPKTGKCVGWHVEVISS